MCLRAVNCKYHSLPFKRLVPGRSAPFDQLLAAFQEAEKAQQARDAQQRQQALQQQQQQARAAQAQAAQQAAQQYGYVPKPLPKKPHAMNGIHVGGAPRRARPRRQRARAAPRAERRRRRLPPPPPPRRIADEYGGGGAYASEPPLPPPPALPPPRPDPRWNAEWSSLLRQMPALEAAARDESRWPRPLHLHQQSRKKRRLWGLPLGELVESGR